MSSSATVGINSYKGMTIVGKRVHVSSTERRSAKRFCFVLCSPFSCLNHFTHLQHTDGWSMLGLPTTTNVLAPCTAKVKTITEIFSNKRLCRILSTDLNWDRLRSDDLWSNLINGCRLLSFLHLSSLGVIFAQHWQPGAGRQNAVDDPGTGNPGRTLLHSVLLASAYKKKHEKT